MTTQFMKFCKRPRNRRWAVSAMACIVCASSLLAQNASVHQLPQPTSPEQIVMLLNRVASLEKQVVALQSRLTVDEASVNWPTDAPASGAASKGDQKSAANKLHEMIDQEGESGDVTHPGAPKKAVNRVTAPFQVVDSLGNVIMEVRGGGGQSFRGMQINADNGSFTRIGNSRPANYANLTIHTPGSEAPRVVVGLSPTEQPALAIIDEEKITAEMTENTKGGEVQLSNQAGQPVVIMGSSASNSGGRTKYMDSGGSVLAEIGVAGTHGDVLLGGPGKGIAVWEMTLTGVH